MGYKEMMQKRRQRGRKHVLGICGSHASLCPECYNEQKDFLLQLAQNKSPLPEENPQDFWSRYGLPFLDSWYEVAMQILRETRMLIPYEVK